MPYKLTCPNCDGKKIRGRLRRQELYCGDCGQVWDSPFLLNRKHLISGYKLRFHIKYDGYPIEKLGNEDVIHTDRKGKGIVMFRLVSEIDAVQVYECGVCHQRFTYDSGGGADALGFDESLSHYASVHRTAQIESDG